MARIDVSGSTRNVVHPEKGQMCWGRWSVQIEGGFDEKPAPAFEEALRQVRGLIENTSNAENIRMYGKQND